MKTELKKDNFSDLTTEDLFKKKKSMSFATGLLVGALIVFFLITILETITKGFTPLLIVPLASLPVLIIIYGQLKSINKELKNRR